MREVVRDLGEGVVPDFWRRTDRDASCAVPTPGGDSCVWRPVTVSRPLHWPTAVCLHQVLASKSLLGRMGGLA